MGRNNEKATFGTLMMFAGATVGAAIAILYAPQAGGRTRKEITRFARKTRNQSEEKLRDAIDSFTDGMEDLGEGTSELLSRGGEIAGVWRKQMLHALDRGQKGLESQRKRLNQIGS